MNYVQGPSGGTGGSSFNDAKNLKPSVGITKLSFRWDNNAIRQIITTFSDSDQTKIFQISHGEDSGNEHFDIVAEDGEIEIASVTLYINDYRSGRVAGICIETSKKQKHMIGNKSNTESVFTIPDDYKLIAFCGRSASDIDALGVVYGKK